MVNYNAWNASWWLTCIMANGGITPVMYPGQTSGIRVTNIASEAISEHVIKFSWGSNATLVHACLIPSSVSPQIQASSATSAMYLCLKRCCPDLHGRSCRSIIQPWQCPILNICITLKAFYVNMQPDMFSSHKYINGKMVSWYNHPQPLKQ